MAADKRVTLNERQWEVLQLIAGGERVTSKEPALANTVYSTRRPAWSGAGAADRNGERRCVQLLELVWTVGTPSGCLIVPGLVAGVIWLAWRRRGRQ